MKVSVLVFVGLLCSACVSHSVQYVDDLRIRTAGETNLFRPSMSAMEVSACQPLENRTEYTNMDGEEQHCQGVYVPFATFHGVQSGSMTGLMNAAVVGGAMAGSAYLLADGIRDSATKINQSGGGATSQSNAFGGDATSRTTQSTTQHTTQNVRSTQTVNPTPMPMMGRD